MESVEIFSGGGGLAIGAARAGFRHRHLIEIDRKSAETLQTNQSLGLKHFQGADIHCADARLVIKQCYVDEPALLAGGPPCQPFSRGGRSRSHADERNLFPVAAEYVRLYRPKAFIFENVKGLKTKNNINYLEYIRLLLSLPELNTPGENWKSHFAHLQQVYLSNPKGLLRYKVLVHLANAADYGVPQKRERVFIVGFREDIPVEWSFPAPTHSEASLVWSQRITGDYWDLHNIKKNCRPQMTLREKRITEKLAASNIPPQKAPWKTIREGINDLPEPGSRLVSGHIRREGARSYQGHTGSPYDQPAKALKAGVHGVPGGENMIRFSNGVVRYFTVREAARLQGFPDEYVFLHNWTAAMRQVGNAVPVHLATRLAESVYNALAKYEEEKK